MLGRKWVMGIAAGVAATAILAAPSFARLDKCAKTIDKESGKMQSKVLKRFQKCVAFYRKDVRKPSTPAFSKAAVKCEKQLGKVLGSGGDIDKGVSKLISKGAKLCIDADLLALGHLPQSAFGNRWAQFQGVAALQNAYEQELASARDWVNILIRLGQTGSCPSCVKLQTPPCNETACKLAAATSGCPDPTKSCATVGLAAFNIPVPLSGSSVLKICDASNLISGTSGVYFVLGAPGKILAPAPVGTINTACTRTVSAEGLVQCTGAQKVDYTTCIDHSPAAANDAGATASGACTGDVCAETQANGDAPIVDPDEPLDKLNGGQCTDLTTTSGVAGDAYVVLTSQIDLRPPNDDCTDPTTTVNNGGTPEVTALTSGTAVATVLNADGMEGAEINSDPKTGAPYDCTALNAGDSSGVRLVGSFGAINTLEIAPGAYADSTTGFVLSCE